MTADLMGYNPGAVVNGMNISGILPDWKNNRIYAMKDGNDAHAGLSQFTAYISGDMTLAKPLSSMAPLLYINSFSGGAACVTYGGHIAFIGSTSSNFVILGLLRAADLSVANAFGIQGTFASSTNNPQHLRAPYSLAPLRAGLSDYIVSVAGSIQSEVCVLTSPGLVLTNLGTLTEASGVAGRGMIGTTSGTVFILGRPSASGGFPSTAALGLYVVSVGSGGISTAAMVRVGGPTPPQVDPTWTHFADAKGVAYDQTDGNPIIVVQTQDAVANQWYFVKLNAANGAVIWKCAVNSLDAYGDGNLGRHNIVNQTLYYIGGGNTLYTINTANGTATSQVIGAMVAGAQISEDVNHSIFWCGAWTETTTHPNYIGSYMGTQGVHALSSQWGRFFPNGATAPLPNPPPGLAVLSVNRAWTYCLDGHDFYVLDLGSQGTFVYDFTTKEWSNFATGALATNGGANPQWNFASGVMWGQRIVAGDLTTANVYEMVPSAVKDNDTVDISHVVTGAITTRTRDYHSVDSVRVAASFGLIDEVLGATFNLRFSDDEEKTWSPYYPVTLTYGDYGSEIAWRSLGAFAAPGRIFELSDVGGLIRIDGCDAGVDGFDQDGGDG